jgi:Fe-S-cluster containining protein
VKDDFPYQDLESIYKAIPGVPCLACGDCCVSPTCTMVEFIYLFQHVLTCFSRVEIEAMILPPPRPHPGYEGNLHCVFQDPVERKCRIHKARTLACRFFGSPALDGLKIRNMDNCRRMKRSSAAAEEAGRIQAWLSDLTALNERIAPYYCEPYWVAGLNLECWLAVYFDPFMDEGFFGELKRTLHRHLDLSFLADKFVDPTDLKQKTDKIALLYTLIRAGDRQTSLSLIEDLRGQYPCTGTYFLEELSKIERLLQD